MSSTVSGPGYLDRFTARFADGDVLPALSPQRRFALLAQFSGARVCVPLFLELAGEVEVGPLAAALLAAHPALRTRTEFRAGIPVQVEDPSAPHTADLVEAAEADWPAEVTRLLTAFETGQLPGGLAVRLLRGAGRSLLVLVFDHAVVDEASLRLALATLADPAAQTTTWAEYAHAVHERARFEEEAASPAALAHWRERLRPFLCRPGGPPPAGARGSEAGVVDTPPVPLGATARPTLFPLLLAACHRALGERTTAIGYAWGGRADGGFPVAGCFMNTAVSVSGTDWFEDLEHLAAPFEAVVTEAAHAAGVPWRGSLDALLVFEDLAHRAPLSVAGVPAREWPAPELVPKGPLAFAVRLEEGVLRARVVYDRAATTAEAAGRTAAALHDALLSTVDGGRRDEGRPVTAQQDTEVADLVRRTWAEYAGDLPGADRTAEDVNFFTLGGTSLGAARMMAALSKDLGRPLGMRLLMRHPTLAELTAAVRAQQTEGTTR
ncbi:acyl carrier protein [Crossiella equi]|uniref:Acyl carrier protein n=1 Tax=Crossiella equi TaxID=130796 RepID=A0ABS5A571_9PSEU|nr:phosphopantetheine-binding protein [Crossiella equi]MBP2471456.1 acyl carrier protein [Crossiella equi]